MDKMTKIVPILLNKGLSFVVIGTKHLHSLDEKP